MATSESSLRTRTRERLKLLIRRECEKEEEIHEKEEGIHEKEEEFKRSGPPSVICTSGSASIVG